MFYFALAVFLAAAAEPQEGPPSSQTATPEQKPRSDKKDLEARVAELEREVERLRQNEDEAAPQSAQPPPPAATSANLLNPTVTAIGNGLYRYDDRAVGEAGERIDNNFNVREVELDLRAAVDPFADGVVIASFESERVGEFEAGIEEGYVNIKRLPFPVFDDPPLGLKLKVGRFRPEIGRINRLHLHDLPQMTRPMVIEEFFGEEGFVGNGLSAQFFIPTPFDEESALELTAQLLTGGGVLIAPGPPQSPAAVGNLRWFRTVAGAHNFDLSLIFHFGRTDPEATLNAMTYSADFLYKWKPLRGGEFRSFVVGGQVFYTRRAFLEEVDTDGDGQIDASERRDTNPLGYFAFTQYQLDRSTYLGVRWDDTAAIAGDQFRRRAVSGYLTWYTSEFLRFRVGYERRLSDIAEENGRNSAFAEINLVFGAHPPEPFWVNR
jgi:hypothetical protein